VDSRNESKNDAKREFASDAKELGISNTFRNFAERVGVYSNNTADAYRGYWRECLIFAKENFSVKKIEKITAPMVGAYIEQKISETTNKNTISKIGAAMMKMGGALDRVYSKDPNNLERLSDLDKIKAGELTEVRPEHATYCDKFRQAIQAAQENKGIEKPDQRRAYNDYKAVLANLKGESHKVAGELIQALGMRAHEVSLIKPTQLDDNNKLRYISKGGQLNVREIPMELADKLRGYFKEHGEFRVDKHEFRADLKRASEATGQKYNGIHGLRWSVAQEMMQKLLNEGSLYNDALATVSEFLTHHRIDITEYYLRR
jgi:integrase